MTKSVKLSKKVAANKLRVPNPDSGEKIFGNKRSRTWGILGFKRSCREEKAWIKQKLILLN